MGDQPLPTQDDTTQKNANTHPCLDWDSNPRSQCSSGRRQYVPQTARPLAPAQRTVKVVICDSAYCIGLDVNFLQETNSAEQSPSPEGKRRMATQETPCRLCSPNVNCCVHKSPPLVSILNQKRPVHTFPPLLLKNPF
jgi:hypothetical protein